MPPLRASDADRERVATLLRDHYSDGRLSDDDLSERVESAYRAGTMAELEKLTEDLPAPPGPPRPRRRSALETSVRIHFTTYLLVNLMLIAIWAAAGGGYFWPIWPILGWGIGVGCHAAPLLALRGRRHEPRAIEGQSAIGGQPAIEARSRSSSRPRSHSRSRSHSRHRSHSRSRSRPRRELPADDDSSVEEVAASVASERPSSLRRAAAPDGTVTILFSDIEGSTALNERLGDVRWLELLREHNRVIRSQVAAHDGFEVKSQGDGFMIAFPSARRAIHCAVAIQDAIERELGSHPDGPVRVRIGLHTGEAIREESDFYGKNVVVAARIADAADGGEILASSVVKALTESSGDVDFEDAREVALAGLAGTHAVYRVMGDGGASEPSTS